MANQYTYSLPFTEEELYNDYCKEMMTQTEIAKKYGVSQKVVWRAMKKMDIKTRKAYKRHQEGSANSNWKGGRVLDRKTTNGKHKGRGGYWMVKDEKHPNRNKSGYVYEHTKNALEAAGLNELSKDMCVHHIDCDKWNNDPDNLQICTKSQHGMYHASLNDLVKELLNRNIIRFDVNDGYVFKKENEDGGGF